MIEGAAEIAANASSSVSFVQMEADSLKSAKNTNFCGVH